MKRIFAAALLICLVILSGCNAEDAPKSYRNDLTPQAISDACAPAISSYSLLTAADEDYIRFRLTGEARAEATDYSGSGMMNLRDQQFDKKIFDIIGIPEMYNCLPALCSSAELCGRVSAEAAKVTGLKEGTPVSGGMFDIDACAIAAGVTAGLCLIFASLPVQQNQLIEALSLFYSLRLCNCRVF